MINRGLNSVSVEGEWAQTAVNEAERKANPKSLTRTNEIDPDN